MATNPIDYLGAMGGLQGVSNPGGALLSGVMAAEEMQARRQQQALQEQVVRQKLLDAQREQERDAQYQQAVQQFITNPTAQGAATLQILFPDKREAVKSAWETQGEEMAQTNLRQLGAIFSALSADRPDLATKSLEDRIAAEKQAGRPTQDYEALLSEVQQDPQKAKGLAGYLLASVVGPEKYANVLEQLRLSDKGGEPFTLNPGAIRYDAEGNIIASSPYRPEIIRDPETGAIMQFTPGEGGGPASGGAGGAAPRGIRNNNPGNIKDGAFAKNQPGYKGSDGTFAVFDSPEAGAKAQRALLGTRYLSKGINTPASIVAKYAPSSENGAAAVNNYAAHIARRLGIGVNDPIPHSRLRELQQAMAEFENGQRTAAPARGSVPSITTREQFAALPSGATFRAPDGTIRRKP